MTDTLEQLLQQAAADAGRSSPTPALSTLHRRARRRRVGLTTAPLLVTGLVAATVLAVQPQHRAATPSVVASDEPDGAATVTFVLHDARTGSGLRSPALTACLEGPGVQQPFVTQRAEAGSYWVTVRGEVDAAAFLSCVQGVPGASAVRSDLLKNNVRAARTRWQAAGSEDYSFTVQHVCGACTSSRVRVVVVGGRATSSEPLNAEKDDGFHFPAVSIDELFELLEDPGRAGAASARASFDSDVGFPTRVDVDRDLASIDDEYGYIITDYQPGQVPSRRPEPAVR